MDFLVRFLRYAWQQIAANLHHLILLALAIVLLGFTIAWIWNGGLSSIGPSSQTPPPHIQAVSPANGSEGSSPSRVCADFVFQPDAAPELGLLPFANAKLFVNGVDVTDEMIGVIEDGQGSLCYRVSGSMSGSMSGSLSNGWHVARVVYWDATGEKYDYRWGFRVENSPSE